MGLKNYCRLFGVQAPIVVAYYFFNITGYLNHDTNLFSGSRNRQATTWPGYGAAAKISR